MNVSRSVSTALHQGRWVRIYDRDKCVVCGECVDTCYAGARVAHWKIHVRRCRVERDTSGSCFLRNLKGGVTLSGVEPVLQPDFTYELLRRCKEEGLHTAIETCGNVRWKRKIGMLPVTDLIMMDIKAHGFCKASLGNGAPNERILAAARKFALTDKPIIFRIPVIRQSMTRPMKSAP